MFFRKKIETIEGYTMFIDSFGVNINEKKILLESRIYNFSDIISARIVEDSENRRITSNLSKNSKLYATSDRELINKLDLEIKTKNIEYPFIKIPFLKVGMRIGFPRNSKKYIEAYKNAQNCLAILENIINDNKVCNEEI